MLSSPERPTATSTLSCVASVWRISLSITVGQARKIALVLAFSLAAPGWSDGLFQGLPYSEARQVRRQLRKPLLLEFTASWCGPCQVMQKTTFADPAVIEFCTANYLPIQIDIDKEKELARQFGVNSIPCLIVVDPEGEPLDRVTGLQESAELLGWLQGIGKGPTKLQVLEQKVLAEPGNAQAHHDLAELYLERSQWSDAGDGISLTRLHRTQQPR